ncbi:MULTISPECIES: fimbrial protein [Enterobacter]|uniref:fimbrial protein n=1 Tax=Enterobacter TaxID=547 RepID=UPI002A7F0416|nr:MULTISPECIES: fimbrial protein [Enterobacter]
MKKIIGLSALVVQMISLNAVAYDASVSFSGNVTAATCIMNPSDSTKTLTIPDVPAKRLYNAGVNGWKTYKKDTTVSFSLCPVSVTSVNVKTVTTTGTQLGVYPEYNTPASGSATGIFLVLGSNNIPFKADGSDINKSFDVSGGVLEVPLTVGVASLGNAGGVSAPTAGTYSSTYTVTFDWT